MHHFAQIIMILFGLLFLAIGVAHEWTWLKRRKGRLVRGVVVGNVMKYSDCVECFYPNIEFKIDGVSHQFTSKYAESNKPLEEGTKVAVLVSDKPEDAERYSAGMRYLLSVIPVLFGVLFIIVGIGIKP